MQILVARGCVGGSSKFLELDSCLSDVAEVLQQKNENAVAKGWLPNK